MPRGDRTGPQGLGPMTGRRAGYCAGYNTPGFETVNQGFGGGRGYGFGHRGGGRGFGYGHGYGYGYGRGYGQAFVQPDKETERRIVENQINDLKAQLKALEDRLSGLDES